MHGHIRLLIAATLACSALTHAAEPAGQSTQAGLPGSTLRKNPSLVARANALLAERQGRDARVRVLATMRDADRPAWAAIASEIGLSTQDMEWVVAQRAQRQLVNEQREAHCWVDPACDLLEPIDGWVDPRDDLRSQLGRENYERYQQFITTRDERSWFGLLERRLPDSTPLPEAVIEELVSKLAQGRERFAVEARQMGFTVEAFLSEQPTAHLWSSHGGSTGDEHRQRRESARRYAGWLQETATRYLSTAQMTLLGSMLEQETAAFESWLRMDEIRKVASRAAADPGRTGDNRGPPRKGPLAMARADFLLWDQDYQKQRRTSIAGSVRKYWVERADAALLRLSPSELDGLVQSLSELEFQQELVMLDCITDPDCDEDILRNDHKTARTAEAARILGPEEFAQFNRGTFEEAQPFYRVRDFRRQLPADQQLSLDQARQLAELLIAEEKRGRDTAATDGPGDVVGHLAAAIERNQRLHHEAGKFLNTEQLRLFDSIQEENVAGLRQRVQAAQQRP